MLGWVYERYEGTLQSGKRARYAMYDMSTASFALYMSEESALLDDRPPELALTVKYALPRPQRESNLFEFAFNSEDEHRDGKGRFHEFVVESEDVQSQWIDALPPPREFTVKGYLYQKKAGIKILKKDSWDLRYGVYDVISGFFAYALRSPRSPRSPRLSTPFLSCACPSLTLTSQSSPLVFHCSPVTMRTSRRHYWT